MNISNQLYIFTLCGTQKFSASLKGVRMRAQEKLSITLNLMTQLESLKECTHMETMNDPTPSAG